MKTLKSCGAGDVFIAIPTTGAISPETTVALFGANEYLPKAGYGCQLVICAYDCHVDDQRNYLVRDFLETSCQTFVFIDSDLGFDPADLLKLIQYEQDVVAGVYPKKSEDISFPVRLISEIKGSNGLLEAEYVPTGFLKIKRHVFERLYETVPKHRLKNDVRRIGIPVIFERRITGNVRMGGDVEFCRKWREIGGTIHVDPDMQFEHVGNKDFTGSLSHYLRKKNGNVISHIVSIIEKIKHGSHSLSDIISLRESLENPWAPGNDMLAILPELTSIDDGPILEAGSGITTLILGASGRKVHSLEHDPKWCAKMMSIKEACGLSNVEIHYAPLHNGWYGFAPKEEYSMVLIDGPPRHCSDRSKIVPVLNDSLKSGCIFVVDDIDSGLDMTEQLSSEYNVKFKYFGRMAIGKKND